MLSTLVQDLVSQRSVLWLAISSHATLAHHSQIEGSSMVTLVGGTGAAQA